MKFVARPIFVSLAAGVAALLASHPATSQTAQTEVSVLRVDWNDPELKRFKTAQAAGKVQPGLMSPAGQLVVASLRMPVLAFDQAPLLVRNALGPNAKLVKPRLVIADPQMPVWYHIVDSYGDVSITVDADLRVNHASDADFRIHKRPLSLDGLKQGGKTKISIFDGSKEEGMEGVTVEYTVHKFPDIPYTVTIECRGAAKPHCRDVATITRDQELLRVVSAPR